LSAFGNMSVRVYGQPPYRAAVLHGGPGSPGYMAPVARELAKSVGVIEPLQTRDSLEGQITELKEQIAAYTNAPLTIIGSSWGAILALFFAARHEQMANKLILVDSGVFDARSSAQIEGIRLSRLSPADQNRYKEIVGLLPLVPEEECNQLMQEWIGIMMTSDCYDPITRDLESIEIQSGVSAKVWGDYEVWRDSPGRLKNEFSKIKLPTIVIHGEYDPHPISGIRPFLEECLPHAVFHILPKCGHYPWIERHARDRFFEILMAEL